MDPKMFAEAMVNAAYNFPGETAIRIDVGTFSAEQVRAIFDDVLASLATYKLRLRGVRTDWASFAKLGIPQDTVNSGLYSGIPVVLTASADFDTMEFVFQPRSR